MNLKAKIARIRELDEKSLRESVLQPLLARMGFKYVQVYHGSREKGKDIICLDEDRLGNREYVAVVATAKDLNANVSSSRSLQSILRQVQQCFNVLYSDLYGMSSVSMDRVWVVTSRKIVPGAQDSVYEELKKSNLSKLVRFVSGETLVDLLDKHYPEYWDTSLESAEILRAQKHRLVSFCQEILMALGATPSNANEVLNQVIHSRFPPKVTSRPDRKVTSASSYSVELDSISPIYSHDFFSYKRHCWPAEPAGLVRKVFFRAKDNIYGAMFYVDEVISGYEEVIRKTDPWDLVNAFRNGFAPCYPFGYDNTAEYASQDIDLLEEALSDIDELRGQLETIGKLAWATSLVDSVSNLEAHILTFLTNVDKESFTLFWRVDTVDGGGCLRFLYDDESAPEPTFSTTHTKTVELWGRGYRRGATRALTLEDIIEGAQHGIRQHLDTLVAGLCTDEPKSGTEDPPCGSVDDVLESI
jgi:hypothetical protein